MMIVGSSNYSPDYIICFFILLSLVLVIGFSNQSINIYYANIFGCTKCVLFTISYISYYFNLFVFCLQFTRLILNPKVSDILQNNGLTSNAMPSPSESMWTSWVREDISWERAKQTLVPLHALAHAKQNINNQRRQRFL